MRNYVDFQFPPLLLSVRSMNFALNIRHAPTTTEPLPSLVVIDALRDVEALDQYGTNRFKDGGQPPPDLLHACLASGLRRSVSAEPWRRGEKGQGALNPSSPSPA